MFAPVALSLLFATVYAAGSEPKVACPSGMILAPAGEFVLGRDSARRADERPGRRVNISSFCVDETLVTYAQFGEFVRRTGYVTTAEKRGFGHVAHEGMRDWEWKRVPNANWRQPFGPGLATRFPVQQDYPVVSVSWYDAQAFCTNAGKRLPTEAEWVYASRAGSRNGRYPWGDSPRRADGKFGLNFWQGKSHRKNQGGDGFVHLSPVRAFSPNAWGVFDAVGNVWQWTADWYAPDTYLRVADGSRDPHGAERGTLKVTRGGSWWCSEKTCCGYGLDYRGKTHPSAVFNNKGFRCVAAPSGQAKEKGRQATRQPAPVN